MEIKYPKPQIYTKSQKPKTQLAKIIYKSIYKKIEIYKGFKIDFKNIFDAVFFFDKWLKTL